ncbi:hypothetical protein Taro_038545 [Colocasia esculenta]|uniref:Uncharacterized protein n=1 Tax=Colocasia esculenta TaxID=4460 RepID=A0A843W700_COLES|nr:hypothetical protein [Colocasia esculenta]
MLDECTRGSETTLIGPTRMGVPGNGNIPKAHCALGQSLKCHSTGRRLARRSARESNGQTALSARSESTRADP